MRATNYPPAVTAAVLVLAGSVLAGCAAPARQQNPESPPAPEEGLGTPWAWEMPHCVAFEPDAYQAAGHRLSASAPRRGSGGVGIEVYESGWGERAVAEIREVVRACSSFEDDDLREQNAVVETGFAADESLLVETVRMTPPEPPETWYAAVLRHGDVVVTFRAAGTDPQEVLCLVGADLPDCAEETGPGTGTAGPAGGLPGFTETATAGDSDSGSRYRYHRPLVRGVTPGQTSH